MSPQKGGSRIGECAIDMAFTCQDDMLTSKISKPFNYDNRCPSQSSSLDSNSADICRICHCEGALDQPLITPCYCSGSLRYVHQTCLQQWIKSSNIRSCELCKFQFIMQTKVKPFNEWEYLEMSGLERKKLLCAMLFHIIAMSCVCWSLYVLIDRTLDEVRKGNLEWPFWTKLIVVGIGFMGGIVFMYIQCRAYFVLCKRWKAYNRVIYVQNAPEKLVPQSSKLLSTSGERDNGPSCSFKTYSDNCQDSVTEAKCIDIKGVRNLHIIFRDENRIRFHRDNHEKRALTEGEPYEETSCSNLKDKNSHSLHIQIGSNNDRSCGFTSSKNNNDKSSFGGPLCPSEFKKDLDSKVEKFINKKNFKSDQSVVKIVIEFGKNNGANQMKFSNKCTDENDSRMPKNTILWNRMSLVSSPKRKFNSEEYLDLETKFRDKVANEMNELPTSKLLISDRTIKVPYNNYLRDKTLMKDWRSSEDLLIRNLP